MGPPRHKLFEGGLQSTSTFLSSTDSLAQPDSRNYGVTSRLDHASSSVGSSSEKAPATILFPANKPSSRADAMILDRWVTDALGKFASRVMTKEDLSDAG